MMTGPAEGVDKESSADRTIAMLRQAVGASLADRFRRGTVVYLPAEGEVVVAGDLHGNRVNLIRVLKATDLEHHPDRHLILQEAVHGGPVSPQGGCMSYIVFEATAALKARYPDRVHVLVANHDLAEHMNQVIFKDGVVLNRSFEQGLTEAYGERRDEVRQWYNRFIESLVVACRTEHGLFISHTTPNGKALAGFDVGLFESSRLSGHITRGSSLYELVWGRDFREEVADEFARIVGAELFLVSHTPCPGGYQVPNHRHVILQSHDDKGCYALLPLDRPVTQAELVASLRNLVSDVHPDQSRLDEDLPAPGPPAEEHAPRDKESH